MKTEIKIMAMALVVFACQIVLFSQSNAPEFSEKNKDINRNNYTLYILGKFTGKSLSQLINEFGKPVEVAEKFVTNRYSDVKDIRYVLKYEMFSVTLLYVSHVDKWLVSSILISKKGFANVWDFDIGIPQKNIEYIFGKDIKGSINISVHDGLVSAIEVYNLE